MEKYIVPSETVLFKDRAEISKTYDVSLPDYCQSIRRVVDVSGIPKIDKVSANFNDRPGSSLIEVYGSIPAQVKYISEQNGHLKCTPFTLSFDFAFDASHIPDYSDSYIDSSVFLMSASARPKGPRNLEIKLTVVMGITVYGLSETKLVNPEDFPDAELRMEKTLLSKHIKLSDKTKTVEESIVLDASLPSAAEILDCNISIVSGNAKAVDGKIKYDGKAVAGISYRADSSSESESAEYIYLTKDILFDGEMESQEIPENSDVLIKIIPTHAEAASTFDPYGENRIINLDFNYCVDADVFENRECVYFDDGYCPGYECDFEHEKYSYEKLLGKVDDVCFIEKSLPADASRLTQSVSARASFYVTGSEVREGKLFASGKMCISVNGTNEKSEPDAMQNVLSVHFPIESVLNANPEQKFILNCEVLSAECEIRDGELKTSICIGTKGVILERGSFHAIRDAHIHYDSPKPLCRSEYIIYFPDKDESVWEIAKRYEIPESLLLKENGLAENTKTVTSKTFLIPCRN